MKIFCVNIPQKGATPQVYNKCETAAVRHFTRQYMPLFCTQMNYNISLAVKVSKVGRSIKREFASRYRSEISVVVDMWSSELSNTLAEGGAPRHLAHTFDGSLLLPITFIEPNSTSDTLFSCSVNGECIGNLNWDIGKEFIDDTISYISQFVTLKLGDIIAVNIGADFSGVITRGSSFKVTIDSQDIINTTII